MTDEPQKGEPLEEDMGELIVITDPDRDRYHTFGYISWWDREKVRNASIMVIGAGALGNEVLKNLALMGVGRILVVDFDTIEDSNLSRSVLYRARDNGRKKAEAAAQAVKELNPDVEVMWLHVNVTWQLGLGVLRRMDAVVGCLDNREARLAINKACWKLNKPWVDGAIDIMSGEARVFLGGKGACYECLLTQKDWLLINHRNSCPGLARANLLLGKQPTTPTVSSIIAGVQTQEVMKLVNGLDVRPGVGWVFNGYDNDSYLTEYPVKSECKEECQYNSVIEEIVEWHDGCAAITTTRQLLEFAAHTLGDGAFLELDHEFTDYLEGKTHDDRLLLGRPRNELTELDAIDPITGEMRKPHFTHTITAESEFADLPLARLGIPPLHIVKVRKGWEYLYVELSGDSNELLRFT